MTADQTKLVDVTVPPPDELIPLAVAELDEKLAAWTAAMHEAVAAIQQRAAAQSEAPRGEPALAGGKADSQAAEHVVSLPAAAAAKVKRNAEPAAAKPPVPPGPAAPTMPGAPGEKRDVLGRVVTPKPDTGESSAPQPVSPVKDADEELLATLDAETAKAIRVMRRVSPTKKSIKEFLEEYQEGQLHSMAAHEKKKSWWSRG